MTQNLIENDHELTYCQDKHLTIVSHQKKSVNDEMSIDTLLHHKARTTQMAYLHFHDMQQSITQGLSHANNAQLDIRKACSLGYESGQRSTGGGVLLHGRDLSFGLVLPSTIIDTSAQSVMDNYDSINTVVSCAINSFFERHGIHASITSYNEKSNAKPVSCMSQKTIYDRMLDNKKILGSAQRNKPWGLLHHTSIFIDGYSQNELELLFDQRFAADVLSHSTSLCAYIDLDYRLIHNELKVLISSELSMFVNTLFEELTISH
jgi:lipoate-protein ligase A